jgi:mono/diheme cytochrome c family protein
MSENHASSLSRIALAGIAAACLAAPGFATADEGVEKAGEARFMQYCAVCHGKNAKGVGPFAELMKKGPADLTVLSKNAGGTFPFERVLKTIDGTDLPVAHGGRDMPIWGQEWKSGGAAGETGARGQVLEVMMYLRSIQEK